MVGSVLFLRKTQLLTASNQIYFKIDVILLDVLWEVVLLFTWIVELLVTKTLNDFTKA